MKSFFKLREELDSCCDECADDNLYGSVEEDFEPTGEEQYEDWDEMNEGGLWANIHAKRQRIKAGSGERMREPGSKGAPTASALKRAAESVDEATTPLQFILKNPGKEYPPFDPDPPKKNPGFVKGKKSFSGLARHLAKTAMNKAANVKEEIDLDEAKDTEMYKYIDQSGGQVIKGKSGTYVGYTHSATKGKGANILKHNQTKKYYAAGGSSTAFTAKTTLHDTPEDAARAYHKGNLAEAIKKPNATTRHLRDYPVSDKDVAKPVKKPEKKKPEQGVAEASSLAQQAAIAIAMKKAGKKPNNVSEENLEEAEKGGRKVQLNKPFRTSDGKGKFAVYTKNDKGNVVKVNFGDTTGLTIKTSNPDRRRNFRARHNCDNPGPKHKARYWSCRAWSRGTVSAGLGT